MIDNIRLQNFRSYSDESFEFEPGVNIIVGPNGSGKTNLLEAILAVATGSSYRADDSELVMFNKDWARIDIALKDHTRTLKIALEHDRPHKSYVFDDKPYKILTANHVLPIVLFEPNHLLLLNGQPDLRRSYLDNLLEQTVTGFAGLRKHYRRALAQRNALLKSARRPSKDQLFVWNLRLSELGGAIATARLELVTDIAKQLPELYAKISKDKNTKVSIEYVSKLPTKSYETALLHALEKHLDQDLIRGFTTYGPHRDDFVVYFNGRPAQEVASRGETRTVLLALKIYELHKKENISGEKPLLLLDDVFSELDGKRRHALASFLKSHQTFITTTDADHVLDAQMPTSRIIPLSKS